MYNNKNQPNVWSGGFSNCEKILEKLTVTM